ncbi:DNA-directed DNA polymerase, delta prime subunit [Dehalogenimonas lykanthroporepellens BL-DC-9]|nr:DNA-directed DNA polymerase, delta prime subunit [Dehalogenimonas lykanthroporepellens BL-DC-9]
MNSTWDLIGLDNHVQTLRNMVGLGGGIPGLIFVAPEHGSKHTLATRFTQVLNCTADEAPCGQCDTCIKIDRGLFPDLQYIHLASDENNKKKTEIAIDQIRELIHQISFPPYQGRYRVVVVEEADKLSLSAANALLKTIEEPPDNTVFILLTARVEAIPETIRSRCFLLELPRTRSELVRHFLIEKYCLSEDRAGIITRIADGHPGLAVACVSDDTLISNSHAAFDKLLEILTSGFRTRFDIAVVLSGKFSQDRLEIFALLDNWLTLARDIMLHKIGLREYVRNLDYLTSISNSVEIMEISKVLSILRVITQSRANLERNAGARLCLDLMMIDLPILESE